MAYLLSILTRRRRDPARALAAQQQCTMRDSCRCDDCQVSNTIRYRGSLTEVCVLI
ncbi:hypothetical protein JYU34_000928 [Plutella xylostella]|uniref:Uncharacterized protein n=1 Tax=Plutella xylostella TaxID=51655 RepID=A0ABQ7R5M8_PLUXY|nr:hypothetical protein JYU34_000928 [Plutella xylostella]